MKNTLIKDIENIEHKLSVNYSEQLLNELNQKKLQLTEFYDKTRYNKNKKLQSR